MAQPKSEQPQVADQTPRPDWRALIQEWHANLMQRFGNAHPEARNAAHVAHDMLRRLLESR